jgi:nucleoside-diphosphate-sugar epimerase
MKGILVTGAAGQIGSELVPALREAHGRDAVVASDVRALEGELSEGPALALDCRDARAVDEAVSTYGVRVVYHLAALLSATAERDPQRAYAVNMGTLYNVLEAARAHGCAVFTPSSIAAFGPTTPGDPAPQDTIQRPTTMYGVTKVAGELLCDYYHARWGVDTRGVRYPGLISYVSPPGGGTTDYAVHIFYEALRVRHYTCFLASDTQLDMMYMPDAIRAAMELMDTDGARLEHRNAFNITAMQLTPARLAEGIRRFIPDLDVAYDVDPVRQAIADSWPKRLDDSAARREWGWAPGYGEEEMVADMLVKLSSRLGHDDPTAGRSAGAHA